MAECPSCHSKIEIGSEFFGTLFMCPRCQAMFFISFDGVPEEVQAQAPSSQSNEAFAQPPSNSPSTAPDYIATSDPAVAEPAMDANPSSQDFGQGVDQNWNQNWSAEVHDPVAAEFSQNPEVSSAGQGFQPDYQPLESETPANANPLQEIVDFGNNEVVGTALTYRLLIRGLDIVQHVEELREVLSDSKLGLKFDELKSKIKNGQLMIEKIEAPQAAVLAQRLRTLPLEMHWEQKLYE